MKKIEITEVKNYKAKNGHFYKIAYIYKNGKDGQWVTLAKALKMGATYKN